MLKYHKLVVTSGPYKFILLILKEIFTEIQQCELYTNNTQIFNTLSSQKSITFLSQECNHLFAHISSL